MSKYLSILKPTELLLDFYWTFTELLLYFYWTFTLLFIYFYFTFYLLLLNVYWNVTEYLSVICDKGLKA